MMQIVASLLAGLGMFFTGVKMISTNLRLMTTRRIRIVVSRWADNPIIAGAIGAGIILITQSGPAMLFLIMSLITTGLISTRKALPMLMWANAGGAFLVLFAVLDIRIFVLFILGVAGICYYLEKPARYRLLVAVLFGLGLLFFGLQWIKNSAAPLAQYDWFKSALFHSRGSNLLALGAGIILSIIVQSSIAVSVVAIAMTHAGVLPVDQTIMIIYGTNIGSSLSIWFLSAGLKGTPKQIAMAQVAFNISVGFVFVILFYVEMYTGIPLVKAFAIKVGGNAVSKQMAYVFFLFNFAGAVLLSFFLTPLYRVLEHFWPPTEEESKSKVKYIHDQALREPETAMDLAEKEQQRLTDFIRGHLTTIRATLAAQQAKDTSIHDVFGSLSGEIQAFLNDLMETNLSGDAAERLLNLINRQNLIVSLEEELYQLSNSVQRSSQSMALKPLTQNLLEGLETIFLNMLDAMHTQDSVHLTLLQSMTSDRSKMMESIRNSYLKSEERLDQNEKSDLLYMTNLFERSVWIMGQLGKMIENGAQYSLLKN